ncbi:hypothetical protein CDD83_4766 [Cordyceps sp. RAO-2017]|nr:hypothetical protein CDD83_4766 [Cordyceps sp. RAO-2017]
MPDIRSFFSSQGGAARKPAPAKSEEPPKPKRAKGRKVVEDSDDDEDAAEQAKPATKPAPRKKKDLEPKGVAISADEYFASGSKPKSTAKANKDDTKTQVKTEAPVRSSPRNKKLAPNPVAAVSNASPSKKRATTSHKQHKVHDDEDAFMDDAEEDGEDIHAAEPRAPPCREHLHE